MTAPEMAERITAGVAEALDDVACEAVVDVSLASALANTKVVLNTSQLLYTAAVTGAPQVMHATVTMMLLAAYKAGRKHAELEALERMAG